MAEKPRTNRSLFPDSVHQRDPRDLAQKLKERLEKQPSPVSLDAAHALMVSHPENDVRSEYAQLIGDARERNANRHALRSNRRIHAIVENPPYSAVRYLLSFVKTHRYDEKTKKIQRCKD